MALDQNTSLSVAELAIYLVLVPFTAWLLYKHGRRALLAYGYLFIFQSLRIVAAILQINAHNHHTTSTGGLIIDAVGLSPLLLSLSGFLYELSRYHTPPGRDERLIIVKEVLIHFGASTGIGLAAVGASDLVKSDATQSDINHAHTLQEAGIVLLLLTWIALVYMCIRLCRDLGDIDAQVVLLAVACILVGIRAVYSVVYAFDHSPSVSPITGAFALKVILVVLVQLLAVLTLLALGFLTRTITAERGYKRWGGNARSEDVEAGATIPLRSYR